MPGKSAAERFALEQQNRAIMAVFEGAGFAHIEPDMLQPADLFLESSGEAARARTYVFADPAGVELALRPDLTVPSCRYYLSHEKPGTQAHYCYCGTVFRCPTGPGGVPEFTQAGIEWYADRDAGLAEARVLQLALAALEAAGLEAPRVTIGDLGLFAALLTDMRMPARWRERLQRHFWRGADFQRLLEHYQRNDRMKRTSVSPHVDLMLKNSAAGADHAAQEGVLALLAEKNLSLEGTRTAGEIATRLQEKAQDRSEAPLDGRDVADLLAWLARAPSCAAEALPAMGGKAFRAATQAFARRLAAMEELGLDPRRFLFQPAFGRDLEYYTGFVFQIEAGDTVVAGGGRYDRLMSDLGAPIPVSAVGCALHTDLLAGVRP